MSNIIATMNSQPHYCELSISSELKLKINFTDPVHVSIDKCNTNNISGGHKLSEKLYVHYKIESTDDTDCTYQDNTFCEFTMNIKLHSGNVFIKIVKSGNIYKCTLKSDTLEYDIIV